MGTLVPQQTPAKFERACKRCSLVEAAVVHCTTSHSVIMNKNMVAHCTAVEANESLSRREC